MTVANAFTGPRRKVSAPSKSRRLCNCGCGKRASHMGQSNGVTLMMGCEFSVALWVKSPASHSKAWQRFTPPQSTGE